MKQFAIPLALGLVLTSPLAIAQPNQEQQFGPWVWGVSGAAVHQADAGLDDSDGEFSVNRGFAQVSAGYAWDRRTSASLSVGAGSSNYQFDSEVSIEGEAPWGRIKDYQISTPVRFSPVEKANVIVIPSIRSFAETGASFSDGQTEGILVGAGWKFSDRLTLGPGFGWFSELGGGSTAFPIIVVDWKITERLSLETGSGMAASQGPGLTLAYALDDHWSISALARYERTRFALDNDRGFGEDRSAPLILSLGYSPWPMTSASLFIGAEVAGRLSLEDSRGKRIAASDYDTAAVIGFSFSSRF